MAKSILARIRSPGRTLSRPLARARIFSVIVMPMQPFLSSPSASLRSRRRLATSTARRRSRAEEEMARLDIRVTRCNRLPPLLPQPAGEGHGVRLVDHHDLALCDSECVLDDPRHTQVSVQVLLNGNLLIGAPFETTTHAHV